MAYATIDDPTIYFNTVTYSGNDIEVGFNVNYLIEALAAISSKDVRLSMVDGNSSCLICDPSNNETKFVVMPMRL